MAERLKIKFTGNEIEPSKVSANEFAKIVACYENALLAVINKKHPARNGIDFISIVEVKHESLTIEADPHVDEIKEAANEINTAIKNNKVNFLPYEVIENLVPFQQFVNKYGCKAILNGIEGVETAEITVESDIKISEALYYKGETTIYGKIIRIGGAQPRVRIETESGKTISVITDRKNAKNLSPHLYGKIGIKGVGKWKKENDELVELKPKSFVVLSEVPLTERLKGLSNLLSKYWKNIENPDDYITSLRG
ncbi:hypothetical protein [Flavobacterium wongokense]|uniref:hypothetical protein n=1 Tax=Flavobacterium wongokense TaxID=2910674 RepID=UPI001F400D3D|nr:hypothetical protein [Flavobacterium sp. WG47]MCF6133442.1 hypothetical protein [Flavobacterium sp. WG47]